MPIKIEDEEQDEDEDEGSGCAAGLSLVPRPRPDSLVLLQPVRERLAEREHGRSIQGFDALCRGCRRAEQVLIDR